MRAHPLVRLDEQYAVLLVVGSEVAWTASPDAEIGTGFNLSINTVKACLRTVLHKFAARNRAQLIASACG